MTSIKIIIADDHDIFRHGLRDILVTNPSYEVIASCRNGQELIEASKNYQPDLIITDLKMPGINGIEAIRTIHLIQPDIRFLALSHFDSEFMIASALDAGVTGYLTKDVNKEELFVAIDSVYKKQIFYSNSTAHKLALMAKRGVYNSFSQDTKPLFSETEKKMIAFICDDKSCKEIAQELSLSVRTIETYRSIIFKKMNVNSSAGMTIFAIKNGLYQYEQV
ncbi:MAG: response regulator transcription factor [Sediminibacterium sp.]|jgi:DNA-binding NarL/FixJ family response regulator|uniref:response regulator transcription factor n=1 Tax=Sediminibacterium sp. TaxID=1917865 RepID=UPI002AB97495|nr:response regulator transcription factor [Sediminibacterium sp.]MDZ4071787.1 response regulator transcription factor [Sediminibacterium sp.]